ncbi:MAG: hypothetical protein ACM31C_07875 [Acidobacteriota bacterium]
MRLATLLVLTACGRIGFAPLGDGALANGDGNGGDGGGDGALAGGVVVPLSSSGSCPAVAWSGSQLGVAWIEGTTGLEFAAYDATGTLIAGPLAVGSGLQNLACPAIAWTGGRFLVAAPSGSLNRREIVVATIAGGVASATTNATNDSGDSVDPSLASDGATAMLGWLDVTGTNYNAYAMALTTAGSPTSGEVRLSALQSDNTAPTISATAGGYAAVWNATGGPRVVGLDSGATPAGPENVIGGTANGIVASAWTGSDLIAAWATSAGDTLATARFATSGAVTSGPQTFAAMRSQSPALVWTGSAASLVYYETYGLVQYWLAQLDGTGAFVSEVPLANAALSPTSSLVWTGTQLVAGVTTPAGALLHILPP